MTLVIQLISIVTASFGTIGCAIVFVTARRYPETFAESVYPDILAFLSVATTVTVVFDISIGQIDVSTVFRAINAVAMAITWWLTRSRRPRSKKRLREASAKVKALLAKMAERIRSAIPVPVPQPT